MMGKNTYLKIILIKFEKCYSIILRYFHLMFLLIFIHVENY